MGILDKRREKKQEQQREAQMKARQQQQRVLMEITRSTNAMNKFEVSMDRRLRTAVNKAIIGKNMADQAMVKNAYIDIRMAMRFKSLATGMASTMNRLQSNVEFARMAEDMGAAITDASKLTALNPNIDLAKLESTYNRVLEPLGRIADQMEQFNELSLDSPYDDYQITDEDVERLINTAIANPAVLSQPAQVYDPARVASAQPSAVPPFATTSDTSMDNMINELNDLAKRLGKD